MRRYIKLLLVAATIAAAVFCSTGCFKKEIVTAKTDEAPDLETRGDVEIDWEQVKEDCEDILNQDEYPYGLYLDFAVHYDENVTELIWPLSSECSQLEALDYGKAYIKAFNDAVATQDFNYAMSSDDYYGGYWDAHDLDLMLFWNRDIMNPEEYLVNQYMKAGSNDPVLPQIRASVQESVEAEKEKEQQEQQEPEQ